MSQLPALIPHVPSITERKLNSFHDFRDFRVPGLLILFACWSRLVDTFGVPYG